MLLVVAVVAVVIMVRLQMVEELDVVGLDLFQECWGAMQLQGMEI